VGKSTLINAIIGQKIAIVTHKPQTTRQRQLGIRTSTESQIIFIDTPGIHDPHTTLGDYMVRVAYDAMRDADVILWIVDVSQPPNAEDKHIAQLLRQSPPKTPVLLVLNKCDLVDSSADKREHLALIEPHAVIEISAKDETGLDALIENINTLLPLGPRYYPAEQVSETNLRFIAAEAIREQIIQLTTEEIPYTVAVEVNRFKEKDDLTVIEAFIYVERDSQKGIIIGKKGSMIKQIGVNARQALEKLLGMQVHLETRVKVLKNWRTNEQFMKRIGYDVSRGKDD
jgi:GTP-binding protein Era